MPFTFITLKANALPPLPATIDEARAQLVDQINASGLPPDTVYALVEVKELLKPVVKQIGLEFAGDYPLTPVPDPAPVAETPAEPAPA